MTALKISLLLKIFAFPNGIRVPCFNCPLPLNIDIEYFLHFDIVSFYFTRLVFPCSLSVVGYITPNVCFCLRYSCVLFQAARQSRWLQPAEILTRSGASTETRWWTSLATYLISPEEAIAMEPRSVPTSTTERITSAGKRKWLRVTSDGKTEFVCLWTLAERVSAQMDSLQDPSHRVRILAKRISYITLLINEPERP